LPVLNPPRKASALGGNIPITVRGSSFENGISMEDPDAPISFRSGPVSESGE
jgi:hypothetical protein